MTNLNVSYSAMTTGANQLLGGKQELTDILLRLQTQVDGLVSAGFVTQHSSVAFHENYRLYSASVTGALNGLEGMATFLTQAAQAMEQTDVQLASAIQR